MKSRRCAREAALQALYQCDTVGDWTPESIDLFFTHFKGDGSGHPPGAVELNDETDAPSPPQNSGTEPARDAQAQQEGNMRFARTLASGVAEHIESLDRAIGAASTHWSVARMARVDRNILRLASFEIAHLDDIPLSVSINEAIEVAKRFGGPESPTFINGVLDNIAHAIGGKKLGEQKRKSAG